MKTQSVKSIIDPPKEFLIVDDLIKTPKYLEIVYSKIFSEITLFVERSKKISLISCNFNKIGGREYHGLLKTKSKDQEFSILMVFNKGLVTLYINSVYITDSNIFGAQIDKENQIAKNIKIDLTSFKRKIHEII